MRPGVFMKRVFAVVLCVALFAGNIGYLKAQNEGNGLEGVQTADQQVEETADQEPVTYASNVDMSGFKANFYKYNMSEINAANEAAYNTDPQAYKGFLNFTSTGSSKQKWNSNHYEGVYQGLIKDTLSATGQVQFNYAAGNLFGGTAGGTGVEKTYTDVTFPMNYNTDTGYYEFDSDVNSLTLNDNNEAVMGAANSGFWPFGKKQITFGMNFSTDFYTTQDGTVDNQGGAPMVFDFSGDDDVWVFIDGRLVIDLGGVHPAVGANIDLQSGAVNYYTNASEGKGTIYASVLGSSYNVYDSGMLDKANVLNAGKHTLQIFYLERGGSKSNCKIKFNLPQVPCENILQVTNKVSTTVNGQPVTDDTAFTYQIKVNDVPVANKGYVYTDSSQNQTAGVTDANGCFTLKDGETALFQKPDNGTYVVSETLQTYYSSSYNATVKIGSDEKGGSHGKVDAPTSGTLDASLTLDSNYDAVGNYRIDFVNDRVVNYTMQTTKTAKLKDWQARTYNIALGVYHTTDDAAYTGAPRVSVIDYVDKRFVVLKDDGSIAKAGDQIAEGTVGYDEKEDSYFILWTEQEIHNGSAENPSWSRQFTIQAKENYVGGNKITTNGASSGVTVGNDTVLFPMPEVNVRISWSAADEKDTIFLGETLENYCTEDKINAVSGARTGLDISDVQVATQWKDGSGSVLAGDITSQIKAQSPQQDTSYTADTTVTPNMADIDYRTGAVAEAMMNEDGIKYTASMQNAQDTGAENVSSTGVYEIHVVEGELTIFKNFDLEYLKNIGYTQEEKDAVAAAQSVVFTIDRYAPEDTTCAGEIIDTYKAVITYDAAKGASSGSVKVTGLSIGNYKVTEATNWSWKYILESTTDTYVENDGILFIGNKDAAYQTSNGYFGEEDTQSEINGFAGVTFTNKLDQTKEWFSDTIHTLNIFK